MILNRTDHIGSIYRRRMERTVSGRRASPDGRSQPRKLFSQSLHVLSINRLGRCEKNSERYLGGPSEQMAVCWELADNKSWFVRRVRSARQGHVVYGAGGRSILQSKKIDGRRKPTAI
jgi:hypothetical protein